jgi:hypothetical protein
MLRATTIDWNAVRNEVVDNVSGILSRLEALCHGTGIGYRVFYVPPRSCNVPVAAFAIFQFWYNHTDARRAVACHDGAGPDEPGAVNANLSDIELDQAGRIMAQALPDDWQCRLTGNRPVGILEYKCGPSQQAMTRFRKT